RPTASLAAIPVAILAQSAPLPPTEITMVQPPPTGFHSKRESGGLRFYHLVRNVTGTVACHPWLGADFHCRSVFIAGWSKYGFPVEVTIWMFVTVPCVSNVNRKRPVPACPGRDWPGGNDGAGA